MSRDKPIDVRDMAIIHRTFRDRAYMKGFLPPPVRMLYPFLIDRPWKKYASTLRTGT